jgi:hypothetical protein
MEMGEEPRVAAELGGKEVQLAVLAATVSTSIVFFPVMLLFGVSKYLFSALALAVVLALFASYLVAMTVIPLFFATFIRLKPGHVHKRPEERLKKISSPLLILQKSIVDFDTLSTSLINSLKRFLECMNAPLRDVWTDLFLRLSAWEYLFCLASFFIHFWARHSFRVQTLGSS